MLSPPFPSLPFPFNLPFFPSSPLPLEVGPLSPARQTCSQVLTVRVQVQVQVLASQVQVQVLNLRVQVRDSMSQPVFLVISKKNSIVILI